MKDKIIFFDGECSFCNSTVDFIWKKNKKRNLYYSSLQSDFAIDFLNKNDVEEIKLDTIYFYSYGKVFSKTKAFVQVLKELSWPYRFAGKTLNIMPIYWLVYLAIMHGTPNRHPRNLPGIKPFMPVSRWGCCRTLNPNRLIGLRCCKTRLAPLRPG